MQSLDLSVDVREAAALDESLHTRVTVTLPEPSDLPERPVVCFGFPGAGYSRGYFTFDMPGATGGGEAGWHAARGWVFVACDHLGVGASDTPADPAALSIERIAAVNHATVEHVWARLRDGTLADGFPALTASARIGIGQSMGGCFTIAAQGRHATFDAIGVLGFSAVRTVLWMPPGTPSGSTEATATGDEELPALTPGFHLDDVPRDVVEADMLGYPFARRGAPPWASASVPACAVTLLEPGVVAAEAASVRVPVLIAVGERDTVPDPHAEPGAYAGSPDVTLYVCARMAHMHNFAGTRERLWQRVHAWGDTVAAAT